MDYDVFDLNIGIAQILYRHFVDSLDDEQGGFGGKSVDFINTTALIIRFDLFTFNLVVIMPIQEIRNIDFKDCTTEAEMVKITLKKIVMWYSWYLYDQAQLLMSYIEVYLITKDKYYAERCSYFRALEILVI
ncbi:hypothetical protein Glove_184g13 [Diversispora epigaea]|uniref:Uncharacterized protein n=1 Tax=Diversispora epigaea TaxID=1348612 RepID=A0A397IW78_9GLOM|nr:hypothetical protein Glove_184g13 [Diversispora epigaea]